MVATLFLFLKKECWKKGGLNEKVTKQNRTITTYFLNIVKFTLHFLEEIIK